MFNPPHPGSILKELYLEPLNLTVTEASISLGVTRKTLSFLINEKSSISSSMAIRLSAAFPNTSPEYWLNLQQQYDIWNAKKILMFLILKYYFTCLLKLKVVKEKICLERINKKLFY